MKLLRLVLPVCIAAVLSLAFAQRAHAGDHGPAPAAPTVGQAAPDFNLPSTSGGKLRLKNLKGKTVVLYFYPKDETPGCTKEACDFRDNHGALDSAGVVLLGVSTDDIASHNHFREKEHLPFPLLADVNHKVCTAYGVYKERERDGKKWMGVERTTFVIDKTGHIARVWPQVNVNGHVAEVLEFVRGS